MAMAIFAKSLWQLHTIQGWHLLQYVIMITVITTEKLTHGHYSSLLTVELLIM